jgi:hypothetical protein
MSEPLKDLRAKVTPETAAVLEGIHRATGQDISEIVRSVLHIWASEKIAELSMVHKMLQAEGLPGIAQGNCGNRGDSQK